MGQVIFGCSGQVNFPQKKLIFIVFGSKISGPEEGWPIVWENIDSSSDGLPNVILPTTVRLMSVCLLGYRLG